MSILNKIHSRLFLKVTLLFSLSLIITVIALAMVHRFFLDPMKFPVMHRNAVSHAQYIIQDIGNPPDLDKAKDISAKLGIELRIITPGGKWSSSSWIADFQAGGLEPFDKDVGIYTGLGDAGMMVEIQQNNNIYFFIMHPRKEGFHYVVTIFVLTIIAFATCLITAMYFIMRWMLRPVKTLGQGVAELSAGNLQYVMTTKRKDELGQLVDSFNRMTGRLNEMLRAREQLLLDVSHELRSPLTRMKVALEFLDDNDTKQTIRDDIIEVETMITELLETERLDSNHGGLDLTETDMLEFIDEICNDFSGRKPGFKIIPPASNIRLNIDRQRFAVLFRNILENALRYTAVDGYPVEISLREKKGESIIAVQDFGCGIPEQDIPYIFEPFYRVDKSRSKETGGYGLGLSLAKKIMEAHGGRIEVSSRVNVGTTIFLTFKK